MFVQDGLLVRKWSPFDESLLGDVIVQIVVPEKFQEPGLKIAHEGLGHFWDPRHFFSGHS